MLGGAEKQAMKDMLGKKCISLPRSHPKEIQAVLPRSAVLPHLQSSDCLWEEHPGIPLCGAVKLSFLAMSVLLPVYGRFIVGIRLFWIIAEIKSKVLRARTVAVLTTSVIHSCCCNSAFPPSLWCFLLPGAGFLSHQTVRGLVGANPQCYTTHLVEFFGLWLVADGDIFTLIV